MATRLAADTKYLLNTFNAAAQLPSDVIAMISFFLPADQDIFVISQVCRRWRTTLASFPLLWTQVDCKHLTRTIASLERHRSVPLQLKLHGGFSTEALNMVLDHGTRIASVSAQLPRDQLRLFHPRLVTPSAEELVLFVDLVSRPAEKITVDIQGEFMSLRRLLVSGFFVPIDKITAPNLIHLCLEGVRFASGTTVPSVLSMLRGCPQLETILISFLAYMRRIQELYAPVTLPKLRSIELGCSEVYAGLVIPLRFPASVAVGFRGVALLAHSWIQESIQHVLEAIDIQSVTLAHIRHDEEERSGDGEICLIRYEGPRGSLEIINLEGYGMDPFIGPEGLLLSHSPRLDNVKTLHLMDCRIGGGTMTTIAPAMNNLISIKFTGHNVFPSTLIAKKGSPALFPHLKHIAGLPPGRRLARIARSRKESGMPLISLDVNGNPEDEDTTKCIAELKMIVGDVKVWQCADLPECWTSNALLDAWDGAGYRGPVSAWLHRRAKR